VLFWLVRQGENLEDWGLWVEQGEDLTLRRQVPAAVGLVLVGWPSREEGTCPVVQC
jgi:hypothetical protein